MKTSLLMACVCLLGSMSSVIAAENESCRIHVILFTPADVRLPTDYQTTDYQTRVDDLVACAESYFASTTCRRSRVAPDLRG